MRGIVSVTLTSILSHRGRGGQGRCFEMVSKWGEYSTLRAQEILGSGICWCV